MQPHKHTYLVMFGIALLASCMLEPVNEREVSSRSSTIDFYGLTNEGEQDISIQARASSRGDWSTIATATSNSAPFLQKFDTDLFLWEATAVVPEDLWDFVLNRHYTRVRARLISSLGVSRNLHTFDTEQDDTRRCLESTDDWREFVEKCASHASPVVTIYAPRKVIESEFVIASSDIPGAQRKKGSWRESLPSLSEPAITFTSFLTYDLRGTKGHDDDYSVSIQPNDEKDEIELAWKHGRGDSNHVHIYAQRIVLPDAVRVHHREPLSSDQLREYGLPMERSWPMDEGDRCVVIVELRKTWGSDDDASYRFRTNNKNGGSEICTLTADLGHGKRDFSFVVTVLAWKPEGTDFGVNVNLISTSESDESFRGGFRSTPKVDLPKADVRISNPVVDWGSDDDVSFQLEGGRSWSSTGKLSYQDGFREITFEIVSLYSIE